MSLLRRHQLLTRGDALGHGSRCAADRIGHVVVRRSARRTARRSCAPSLPNSPQAPATCCSSAAKVLFTATRRARTWSSVSYGSVLPSRSDSARRIAQSSRASPGGKIGAEALLNAALRVHVGAGLLGVGRARQDDVGTMGAGIAVVALVDHEGLAELRRVDLVGAQQIDDVDLLALRAVQNAGDVATALARHQAEIEAADAAAAVCRMAKPFQSSRTTARLTRQGEHGGTVVARERAHADDDQRVLGGLELLGEADACRRRGHARSRDRHRAARPDR